MITRGWVGICVILAHACTGDPPNTERVLPQLHPPPTVDIPMDLRIDVFVNGKLTTAIETGLLGKTKPDFNDENKVAWRLDRLILLPTTESVEWEITTHNEVVVRLRQTSNKTPVLLLNRRGEPIVQLVDPTHPFPDYHGAGGRLKRSPVDSTTHIVGVVRVSVFTETNRQNF